MRWWQRRHPAADLNEKAASFIHAHYQKRKGPRGAGRFRVDVVRLTDSSAPIHQKGVRGDAPKVNLRRWFARSYWECLQAVGRDVRTFVSIKEVFVKIVSTLLQLVLACFFASGVAVGAEADKAKKQAEVRKAAQTSLDRFYKTRAELKGQVSKAPGYAVFTTYGLSFIVGGAGGHGLAHDQKNGKNTYMSMAQASAGLQVGAAQSETLIIFKSAAALAKFVDKGWEFGGGAAIGAGAGGKSAEVPGGGGENLIADALYYTLTKNGLQAGGAVAGTKFWKDADLN